MKDTTTENNHEQILKSTGLFGFTQVIRMVVGVISTKLVAVFLGPVGIGTLGLLTNTISIISAVTSFGFSVTSIREISLAEAENDSDKQSYKIAFLLKWAFIIGLFGMILTIAFSTFLSTLTFGNSNKYSWFILLSINFLIISLTTAQNAILQGKRMLKQIAFSTVITSILVAIVSIPLYYLFRFKAIIPVILVSSSIGLLVNYYFTRNSVTIKSKISFSETVVQGKPMIKLGFLLSLNIIFGYVCTYIIKIFLNKNGASPQIVGFYEVSSVILISYLGMIFTAMGTDFYPKLTAIQEDNKQARTLVNNQIEIGLLLVTPAILFMYFVSPFFIKIVYTNEFLSVLYILKAALFAIIVKAIIWPLGFVILAKGDKKQYFKQELVSDILNISFTLILFYFYGLIGIGIATFLHFSIYGFYVYFVVNKSYNFTFTKDTVKVIIQSMLLGTMACVTVFSLDYPSAFYPLGILTSISFLMSYIGLNKRVNLNYLYLKFKDKIFKNR